MEHEADFEIADEDGWQPIHAAAAWGHVSTVSLHLFVDKQKDYQEKTTNNTKYVSFTFYCSKMKRLCNAFLSKLLGKY